MKFIDGKFTFTGTVIKPKKEESFFKKWTSQNGNELNKIFFGIKDNDGNVEFVSLLGMIRKDFTFYDDKGETFTVDWSERKEKQYLDLVPRYRKFSLFDDEYISNYDFINAAHEYLQDIGDEKICVTGHYKKSTDQYGDSFEITNIYHPLEGANPRLGLTLDLIYNEDCIDKSEYKKDHKIYLDAYVSQYINKDSGRKYIKCPVVFNATKYIEKDRTDLLDYKMSYVNIKGKKMRHLLWECVLLNAAEEVEFDESMLTPKQREQVELGIRDINYFKPHNGIVGTRNKEVRLKDPILTKEYENGMIELDDTISEFKENVFSTEDNVVRKETIKSVVDEVGIKTVEDEEEEFF